jgi:surfeit locus 1 family protein
MLAGIIGNRRFLFRPVLTICVLAGLAMLVSLGAWQLKRLDWKQGLIAKIEARAEAPPLALEEAIARADAGEDMEYAPVRVRGRVQPDLEARLFGSYEGAAGIYLFAVVEPQDLDPLVYVNLGFVPQSVPNASAEAPLYQALGNLEITGLFRYREELSPPASWFQSAEQSSDGLWFVRDPLRFAKAAQIEASPYYIDSFARDGAPWPKGGTTRLDFRNNHLDYALTWFGLAIVLFGVWLILSLPKR